MKFFNFGKKKTYRSIIKEYYGNNYSYFAYNYAQNIYSIPEVRTAIESFADIFSSIPKYYERKDKNGNIVYFENELSKVINLKPNPLQNATQFWKEVITRLMLESNVFIEPIFESGNGNLKYLYVLPNKNFQFNYLNDGNATVTFIDTEKGNITKNLNDIIYLNRFSALSGGKKNDLGLYETVIQALMKQALNVADPNKPKAIMQGAVGATSNLKPEDKSGEMENLKINFAENVNGVAYLDSQWKITPVNWQENDVNRELMKLVVDTVYNYFGISDNIINGKSSELEYSMFISNKINPLARQVEEEFTSKLFTGNEINFGNKIELDTFSLSISTLQAKTSFFSVGLRTGVLNIDEAREMVGLAPLPEGLGQKWRTTLDTVDIGIADEFQLSKNGVVEKSETDVNNQNENGKEVNNQNGK